MTKLTEGKTKSNRKELKPSKVPIRKPDGFKSKKELKTLLHKCEDGELIELKGCPFCGEVKDLEFDDNYDSLTCRNCLLTLYLFKEDEKKLIEKWNNRIGG